MPKEACAQVEATDYRWTHRGLLVDLYGPGRPALPDPSAPPGTRGPRLGDSAPGSTHRRGGILLPIGRSLSLELPGLALAAELALAHQCRLVVICSREAKAVDFPDDLQLRLGDLLVLVDLVDVHPAWVPALASSEHRISKLRRENDVGSKRNIGLAVAVTLGWEYLLFVDDDISPARQGPSLDPAYLTHALSALDEDPDLAAVGWTLEDFDDNSVVGHARPLVGLPQGIFIGGGALLVRCTARMPFFPDIYNEDWLFLIALAAGARDYRQALSWGGRVHQLAYLPFRPQRAASEEAGEIVGEGLMNLLEDVGPGYLQAMSLERWQASLASRLDLLRFIGEQATGLPPRRSAEFLAHRCLEHAMKEAISVHADLGPDDLMSFVRQWHDDEQGYWRHHLTGVRARLGLAVAEDQLKAALEGRLPTPTVIPAPGASLLAFA